MLVNESACILGTLGAILLIFINHSIKGQDEGKLSIKKETPLLKAAARFEPRPKFFEIEFIQFQQFNSESFSEQYGDSQAKIKRNSLFKIKLKVPIILKPNIQFLGGLKYGVENYSFKDIRNTNYELYNRLEVMSLKSIGADLFIKKMINDRKFIFGYINGSLNSDNIQLKGIDNQLKVTISAIYGINKSPETVLGFGIGFGLTLGRPSVFPLFVYYHQFNQRIAIQSLLPKKIELRYGFSRKLYLYTVVELNGTTYHLQDYPLTGIEKLEFRRTSIRYKLKLERELYDFLWIGITYGYRDPIFIYASNIGEGRRKSLIDVEADSSTFWKFSIFFVVPGNLYNKAKGR